MDIWHMAWELLVFFAGVGFGAFFGSRHAMETHSK